VAFSQSSFTASEGDGIVPVCAELLTGDLDTEISLLIDVLGLESNTGTIIHPTIGAIFRFLEHKILGALH
jgi:hypothetical protein